MAVARREGALVMVHAENHDCIAWMTEQLVAAGRDRAQIPCRLPAPRGRARGDPPRDHAGRNRRRAGPDRPRLRRRGRRADRRARDRGPAASMAKPARNTCSSPPPTSTAGVRGRQVHLLAAAARRGDPGRAVARPPARHAQVSRPTTRRAASTMPQGKKPTARTPPSTQIANGIPGLETRLPLLFSEGVAKGRITCESLRRPDRDQPGADVWSVPAKGHHRHRRRCRPGRLGPRSARSPSPTPCCTTMSTTRPMRACGHRLAGHDPFARRARVGRRRLRAAPGHGRFLACARPEPARARRVVVRSWE